MKMARFGVPSRRVGHDEHAGEHRAVAGTGRAGPAAVLDPGAVRLRVDPGTPRVIPIGFHRNGEEVILGTPMDAPKLKALRDGQTALCIDTDTMPYKVLEIRGTIRLDVVEGIAPEYKLMTQRTLGEEAGQAWLTSLALICPRMTRVFVHPTWVVLLDFETRFPSAIEHGMEAASAGAGVSTS